MKKTRPLEVGEQVIHFNPALLGRESNVGEVAFVGVVEELVGSSVYLKVTRILYYNKPDEFLHDNAFTAVSSIEEVARYVD